MKHRGILKHVAVTALLAAWPLQSALAADVMYGMDGPQGDEPQVLFTIDPADASKTPVGSFAGFGPQPHSMFGIYNYLVVMDRNERVMLYDPIEGKLIQTLVEDLDSCELMGGGFDGADIYVLDKCGNLFRFLLDGTFAPVGNGDADSAMAINSSGVIYGADGGQLYTIDKTTGASTLVTTITGLPYNHIRAMAFDGSDTLYAIDLQRGCCTYSAQLVTINTTTGAATSIGALEQGEVLLAVAGDTPVDTDGDGIENLIEVAAGLDPEDATDATKDQDDDGLTAAEEIELGTDPFDDDSDGDSLTDGDEVEGGTNPLASDTDNDGMPDGVELAAGQDPTKASNGLFEIEADANLQNFDVMVDGDGNYHFAWAADDGEDNGWVIWYAMYADDGSVLIDKTIVSGNPSIVGDDRQRPQIAIDGSDVWIVYHEKGKESRLVVIDSAVDDRDGDALDPAAVVLPETDDFGVLFGTGEDIFHPQIAVHDGVAHIVGDENNVESVVYLRIGRDGNPATNGIISLSATEDYHTGINLAVDADGNAHVFWGGYSSELYYAMVDGDDADAPLLIDRSVIAESDVMEGYYRFANPSIDADGRVHLVYARRTVDDDGIGGNIEYLSFDPSLAAQDESTTNAGELEIEDPLVLTQIAGQEFGWYPIAEMRDGELFSIWLPEGGDSEPGIGRAQLVNFAEDTTSTTTFTDTATNSSSNQFIMAMSGGRAVWAEDETLVTAKPFAVQQMLQEGDFQASVEAFSGALMSYEELDEADVPEGLDANYTYPYGFSRLVVGDLAVGSTVTLRFTFPEEVPEDSQMFKLVDGAWTTVAAARDGNTMTISIKDGGPLDADGIANGFVVDPVGLGVPTAGSNGTPVNVSGSGGGGCVIGDGNRPFDPLFPALLALAGAYLIRRRMAN